MTLQSHSNHWQIIFKAIFFVLFVTLSTSLNALEVVTINYVNARTGPGTQFETLLTISPQIRFPVVSIKDKWIQIDTEFGDDIWIHSDFTRILPVSSEWTVLKTVRSGNVRLGPGLDFPVISKTAEDQFLLCLSEKNDWFQVILDSLKLGWINQVLVTDACLVNNPESILMVKKSGNFRTGPGLDYGIRTHLKYSDKLLILENRGSWKKVYTDREMTGYVNDVIITPLLNPGQALKKAKIVKTGNLRLGPATTFKIIRKLHQDDTVYLLQKYRNWFEIITERGNRGWVHSILFGTAALPDPSELSLHPDSVSIGINTLEIAHHLRKIKRYGESLSTYLLADSILKSLYLHYPADSRLVFYYAQCIYSIAQNPIQNQDDKIAEAVQILKTVKRDDADYPRINQLLQSWKQAVSTRGVLYNTFTDTSSDITDALGFFSDAVFNYPMLTEAELKRLVGRRYSVSQQNPRIALHWQTESAAIFRAFQSNAIELDSTNQDIYFHVLIELANTYTSLNKKNESMNVLDEARLLIDRYNIAGWDSYYQRTVETLINRIH